MAKPRPTALNARDAFILVCEHERMAAQARMLIEHGESVIASHKKAIAEARDCVRRYARVGLKWRRRVTECVCTMSDDELAALMHNAPAAPDFYQMVLADLQHRKGRQ